MIRYNYLHAYRGTVCRQLMYRIWSLQSIEACALATTVGLLSVIVRGAILLGIESAPLSEEEEEEEKNK